MLKILRWLLGIGWLAGGISLTVDTPGVGGILVSLAGLLILPPTFPFIAQATGKTVSRPLKYIAVFLILAAGYALVAPKQELKAAERKKAEAEKIKQEQLAYEKLSPAVKDSLRLAKAQEEKIAKQQLAAAAAADEKKARQEKVEAQFSAYDGSNRGVEKAIKERMNDPDSYEHVKTTFNDKGDYITVFTQFRGKNAFGGKVLSTAIAKVDFEGHVLALQML